jgi:hypothetical protein
MTGIRGLLLALATGCVGSIDGGQRPEFVDPVGGGVTFGTGGGVASTGGGDPVPSGPMGRTVLHRLSRVELTNVLTDTLGAAAAARVPDLNDPLIQALDTNADALTVSGSTVDSMFETARTIASSITPATLGSCASGTAERDCARQRITSVALQFLRRPATTEELTSYLSLWDTVRMNESATVATQAVVQRLLASPDFLYHVEVGDPVTGKLNDYEMASRLSFLAWESAPDRALYDAAAAGTLTTPAGARVQLERLLAHPKGVRTMQRFFELWSDLGKLDDITKDPSAYPDFESLRAPMREEFSRFIADILSRQGTVRDLLASRETVVDGPLARFYGVIPPASGTGRVTLPPERAGGFLTQGAFLAIHGKAQRSAPILRGIFIRERLLCVAVPPPPPGVSATIPPGTVTDRTTREYFQSLTASTACQGCHALINPLGFTFEGFDGIGRGRTMDNSLPVDTVADVIGAGEADGRFSNAAELAGRLATSEQVRSCLARFWFRSRFRRLEVGGDERVIAQMSEALRRDSDRLATLATALSQQEALFYAHYRTPEATP